MDPGSLQWGRNLELHLELSLKHPWAGPIRGIVMAIDDHPKYAENSVAAVATAIKRIDADDIKSASCWAAYARWCVADALLRFSEVDDVRAAMKNRLPNLVGSWMPLRQGECLPYYLSMLRAWCTHFRGETAFLDSVGRFVQFQLRPRKLPTSTSDARRATKRERDLDLDEIREQLGAKKKAASSSGHEAAAKNSVISSVPLSQRVQDMNRALNDTPRSECVHCGAPFSSAIDANAHSRFHFEYREEMRPRLLLPDREMFCSHEAIHEKGSFPVTMGTLATQSQKLQYAKILFRASKSGPQAITVPSPGTYKCAICKSQISIQHENGQWALLDAAIDANSQYIHSKCNH